MTPGTVYPGTWTQCSVLIGQIKIEIYKKGTLLYPQTIAVLLYSLKSVSHEYRYVTYANIYRTLVILVIYQYITVEKRRNRVNWLTTLSLVYPS